jgi:hypothetical protein
MKNDLRLANARIESLVAYVLAQPETREVKIRSLGNALRTGEYSVSHGAVATALLDETKRIPPTDPREVEARGRNVTIKIPKR